MKINKPLPPKEVLNSLLAYEPETGKLFWKSRPKEIFGGEDGIRVRAWLSWNEKYSGKEAFTTVFDGYRTGSIFHELYQAHRVIWKMVRGEEPANVDHENGKRSDNRLKNLRATDALGNARNAARRMDNRSGVTGVCYKSREQKWQAYINVNGKPKTLGTFLTIEQAISARQCASLKAGYHKNHGRSDMGDDAEPFAAAIINQRLASANRLRERLDQ